jgi:hypothetical protein
MPVSGSIFVYAEVPPVADEIPAPGLYRASVPILRSIADHIAMIGLYSQNRHFGIESVHPALRGLCRSLPRAFIWMRIVRRRLGLPDDFENGLISRLVARWIRQSGATHLLVLEGSDPEVLARADAIARRAGIPFSVYLVDDFECTMRLQHRSDREIARKKTRMGQNLRRARHIFAITDGLAALLRRQFDVEASTMNLAYEAGPAPMPARKDEIFFLGSINFLYLDALQTLLDIVGKLRAETGRDITVRFTHGYRTALDPLPAFARAEPIRDSAGLAEAIAASLFAFLPYSFHDNVRVMVETSFPSKSLECMAYARSLVVYAPDYSSSAKFFIGAGLPVLARTTVELEQEIRRQLDDPPDHRARYRQHLMEHHGAEAVRQTLLLSLLNDNT